jgi:tripartite-type tricarboxylate transporter receptor subunit TctC
MRTKNQFIVGILLFSGLFLILPGNKVGNASEFPSRPVEIIIPMPPGGTTDLSARILGEDLSKSLGVSVIYTNKGGAGGAVGTEYAARAKPDGYTILAASGNVFTILPLLTQDLTYKLLDFIPLCKHSSNSNPVAVRNVSPFKSFEDLISFAKKNPGKLNCATAGFGTAAHYSLEMIKIEAGIDIVHLPVKGGGDVSTYLLGGNVDLTTSSSPTVIGLMKSGDFRALACTLGKIPGFPNIPTLAELGYPKASYGACVGYFLPKGTPKPIMDKLASAFEKVIKNPTVVKNLENTGQNLDYMDSPTFTKFLIEEYKVLEDVSKKAKLIK